MLAVSSGGAGDLRSIPSSSECVRLIRTCVEQSSHKAGHGSGAAVRLKLKLKEASSIVMSPTTRKGLCSGRLVGGAAAPNGRRFP